MRAATKQLLKAAIVESLRQMPRTPPLREDAQLVWHRRDGGWHGEYRLQRVLDFTWDTGLDWNDRARDLDAAMRTHHADHVRLVGTWSTGLFAFSAGDLLRLIVGNLWTRHQSFELSDQQIDVIVGETEDFFDSAVVRLAYVAPIINFRRPVADPIELAPDITIRQLSEAEVTELYGGSSLSMRRHSISMEEWAFVGELEEPKVLGDQPPPTAEAFSALNRRLNAAVVALRTFKNNPVGYDEIHFMPLKFTPAVRGRSSRTFGHEYIPLGHYEVPQGDAEGLRRHTGFIMQGLHPAVESACARLASASVRTAPADKLIDAVIGLEAMLLSSLGGREEYRGELRFRFSLNYAVLHDTPAERAKAKRLAQDLYDLRSKIAHGGQVGATERVGEDKLALPDAANKACDVLRWVVSRFLPDSPNLPISKNEFWNEKYFGT